MESLLRNASFACTNESGIDTETDTEHSSCMLESSCDINSSSNANHPDVGFFNESADVRDAENDDELSISFPEHRAVVIPRGGNFSYICAADSEDETDELQISGVSIGGSDIISDQDLRFQREMEEASRATRKIEVSSIPATEIVDDSCVAVFHEICDGVEEPPAEPLSFNGRIPQPMAVIHVNVDEAISDLFNNSSTTILDSSQASLQIDLSATTNLNVTQTSVERKVQKEQKIVYTSENSPDILVFDSDGESVEDAGEVNEAEEDASKLDLSLNNQSIQEGSLKERERKILKRLQNALAGVLPPPSIRKSALSVETILATIAKNSTFLHSTECDDINSHLETLMKPINSTQEASEASWPEALGLFTHGIHYNRSKFSEKIEAMCIKYAERSIGTETSSSFVKVNSPSSSKKRYMREKTLNQSPGRRLSHLAKRKAMFSCANLQKIHFSSSQPCLSQPSASRQILLGPNASRKSRLMRIRTPKRLSPSQRKTPNSKEKPRVTVKVPPTRETSKRALFQSPPHHATFRPAVTPEIAEKVDRSRRALFSSPKLQRYSSFSQQSSSSFSTFSQSSGLTAAALANRENFLLDDDFGGKRKRGFDDDVEEAAKKARLDGPLGRSQSFTAEYVARQNALLASRTTLCKTASDVCLSGRSSQSNCLTDLEKQKLFYIVSQTLQRKQISGQHERFKEYATVMAKVVKRLFLESNRRCFGSVSEQMSKMASNILFPVLQGKSVEEIYAAERQRRENAKKSTRPSGYVPMESYRSGLQRSASSLMSENSGPSSFGMSQSSLRFSQSENLSQSSHGTFFDTALRENVDSEQRQNSGQKSGQKGMFSGKDQKNVSPHKSSNKKQKLVGGKNLTNLLKAKRQISFDT